MTAIDWNKKEAPRKAFGEALAALGEAYPRLLVLDADVGTSTMSSIFQKKYPDRFLQMGIAEANMLGVAAGLAAVGFTPFVSTFAAFMSRRALDQIAISVAYPRLNVKINGSYGGIPTGRAGATHQALEDIAIMRAIPSMKILAPADGAETRLAVKLALDTEGPVYLSTVRCDVPALFGDSHKLEWAKAVKVAEGGDLTIISCGMMTYKALAAAEILRKDGVSAAVIHMPSVKPIDEEAVVAASRQTGLILTLENHNVVGGLGGAVAEITAQLAPCKVARLGIPDCFGESGDDEEIFRKHGCDENSAAKRAKEELKKKRG
jgi:transketolase